jgi:hypothetical protein
LEFEDEGIEGDVSGFQGFRVSGFQACPTDLYNTEMERDLSRSGGVSGFQGFRVSGFQGFRVSGFQLAKLKASRVLRFKDYRVSELQACPTDF